MVHLRITDRTENNIATLENIFLVLCNGKHIPSYDLAIPPLKTFAPTRTGSCIFIKALLMIVPN